MIVTGDMNFSIDSSLSRQTLRDRQEALKNEMSGEKLYAYVNHNRWVVDCPCCNTSVLYFEDHKFFCPRCKNELVEGKLYHVVMPKDRVKIEKILMKRPWKNRNWVRGESVEQLEQENIEHGLDIA